MGNGRSYNPDSLVRHKQIKKVLTNKSKTNKMVLDNTNFVW